MSPLQEICETVHSRLAFVKSDSCVSEFVLGSRQCHCSLARLNDCASVHRTTSLMRPTGQKIPPVSTSANMAGHVMLPSATDWCMSEIRSRSLNGTMLSPHLERRALAQGRNFVRISDLNEVVELKVSAFAATARELWGVPGRNDTTNSGGRHNKLWGGESG